MNPFGNFGGNFGNLDPSKMDPKLLMELSRLIQQLPQEQLNKMQSLMHNAMAGIDVTRDMAEFERGLPPGFREKIMSLMGSQAPQGAAAPLNSAPAASADIIELRPQTPAKEMDLREARLTILNGVAEGQIPPDEAYKLLFP